MATAMQRLQGLIQGTGIGKPKIGLDTCCVRYYLNNEQPWADCLDPIFQAGLSGVADLYISTIVVSELLAQLYFTNRQQAGYDEELYLLAILHHHFQVLDVTGEIAQAAGRLRGSFPPGKKALETPDALIGATSLTNGHTLFVTNDAQLAEALPPENCIFLRELALEWLAQNFPQGCLAGVGCINPSKRGVGLAVNASLASLELGSVKPAPKAKWQRILYDAITAASALNEPCIFFILTSKSGRKAEVEEVLFWHEGLSDTRSPMRILNRLSDHLGYSPRTGKAINTGQNVYVFCFLSMSRERARQSQPSFTSKRAHQREMDSWNAYLKLLWLFREALRLPQTSWLLCEDNSARYLDASATITFLNQAKNVMGWKERR